MNVNNTVRVANALNYHISAGMHHVQVIFEAWDGTGRALLLGFMEQPGSEDLVQTVIKEIEWALGIENKDWEAARGRAVWLIQGEAGAFVGFACQGRSYSLEAALQKFQGEIPHVEAVLTRPAFAAPSVAVTHDEQG